MGDQAHSPRSQDRVRSHRARMRAAGLRPIQIWVPDTQSASFVAEAHRQSLAVATSPAADLDQAFIDAVSDKALQGATPVNFA
ncbi:MAG: antitoxin MazE family protein [Gammaproteobacteria bacterium]|nr:antitoxin MazE family protein [Gammaproteobacteria bacterium]